MSPHIDFAHEPVVNDQSERIAALRDRVLPVSSISRDGWWLPLVVLMAAILCAPFLRTAWSLSDEGMLLHGAARISRGDRLYADFFEFLPPGGFVLVAGWFKLFGASFCSARTLAILTVAGIAGFTFLACRQASKNAPLSAVLAIAFVVTSQGIWTQVSHHWFTTLFSMMVMSAAIANVERAGRRWPLIAGAAAGAAAMKTPTRGALAMIAAFVIVLSGRRGRKELIAFVLGGVLLPAGLIAYVVGQHAFAAAFDDVIRFTGTRYAGIQSVPFGSWADPQNFLLKALFPLAALLTLFVCLRDWRGCLRDRLLTACASAGLAGFIGCYPRPDMVHIGFAAPMALPLLAYCINRLWPATPRYLVAGVVAGVCLPSAVVFSCLYQGALHAVLTRTPGGDVALISQPGVSALLQRIEATPAGEAYFFYPYIPMLPFIAARVHVARNDIFMPGYTLPSQYRDACASVMRNASWVVIDRHWTDPAVLTKIWPGIRDARPPETVEFEHALDLGFTLVAREGSFELFHRRADADPSVCAIAP
jgi:hypothetical protein